MERRYYKKTITAPGFSTEIVDWVSEVIDLSLAVLEDHFEVKIDKRFPVKLIKCPKGGGSKGGMNGLTLNMGRAMYNYPIFNEYRSFAMDPEIGSVIGTGFGTMAVVIMHEVAHLAHYYFKHLFIKPGECMKAHGRTFKKLYRIIRTALIHKFDATSWTGPRLWWKGKDVLHVATERWVKSTCPIPAWMRMKSMERTESGITFELYKSNLKKVVETVRVNG